MVLKMNLDHLGHGTSNSEAPDEKPLLLLL